MDELVPKEYKASLWVRKDEFITFAVRFKSGSHISIALSLDGESNCPLCKFPFKHNSIMYYGCTADFKCAANVDEFFNPIGDLISCTDSSTTCPFQGKSGTLP